MLLYIGVVLLLLLCERFHEWNAVSSDYSVIHDRRAKRVAILRKCVYACSLRAICIRNVPAAFTLSVCLKFIFETVRHAAVLIVFRLSNLVTRNYASVKFGSFGFS